ncbi:MAG: SDR family oxidoreductase [Actinomycetota bacterium]|nr:SDR family oxidoreductase [Actinomycetota bacterium]
MSDFTARPGTTVVFGASGAIGAAIADALAERGSRVALTFRTAGSPRVDQLIERLGAKARGYCLDLTDAEACASTAAAIAADFGAVHTVVYAAGPHVSMTHLSRVTTGEFGAQVNGDTVAFFNAVAPMLSLLRASAGSIVAVTTAATSRFPVRDGLSAAPKAAIEALVRGLAAEEGRYGVRANSVGPGMLTDGMAARLISSGELDDAALELTRGNIPLRRFGNAADIAEAVCFLASDRAGFITGQKLNVDGGYSV